jgi:hypothetical protein
MLLHKWGRFRARFEIARHPGEAARRCWVAVALVRVQMAFPEMTLRVDAVRCQIFLGNAIAKRTIPGGVVDQSHS